MAASRFRALLAGVEQAKERQAWILRTEQQLKQRLWKKNTLQVKRVFMVQMIEE